MFAFLVYKENKADLYFIFALQILSVYMKHNQLSSNWTLLFNIFLPTLWLTFFGVFLIAVLQADKSKVDTSVNYLLYGLIFFVLIFLIIFKYTVFRLKRIDTDETHIYVTNYFKAARYPFQDIESIVKNKGILFSYGTLILKGKGVFGNKIVFLASSPRLEVFTLMHPEVKVIVG